MAVNSIRLPTSETSLAAWGLRKVKAASDSKAILDRVVLARVYVAALFVLTGVDALMHMTCAVAKMAMLSPVQAKGHAWRAVRSGVAAVAVPVPGMVSPSAALKGYEWLALDEVSRSRMTRLKQRLGAAAHETKNWVMAHQSVVAGASALAATLALIYLAQRAAKPMTLASPPKATPAPTATPSSNASEPQPSAVVESQPIATPRSADVEVSNVEPEPSSSIETPSLFSTSLKADQVASTQVGSGVVSSDDSAAYWVLPLTALSLLVGTVALAVRKLSSIGSDGEGHFIPPQKTVTSAAASSKLSDETISAMSLGGNSNSNSRLRATSVDMGGERGGWPGLESKSDQASGESQESRMTLGARKLKIGGVTTSLTCNKVHVRDKPDDRPDLDYYAQVIVFKGNTPHTLYVKKATLSFKGVSVDQVQEAIDQCTLKLAKPLSDKSDFIRGANLWTDAVFELPPHRPEDISTLVSAAIGFQKEPDPEGPILEGRAKRLDSTSDIYAYVSPRGALYLVNLKEQLGSGTESAIFRGVDQRGNTVAIGVSDDPKEDKNLQHWQDTLGSGRLKGLAHHYEHFRLQVDKHGKIPDSRKSQRKQSHALPARTIFVMKQYSKGSLARYLRELDKQPLPQQTRNILAILQSVVAGLSNIHNVGRAIHKDIKEPNILLDGDENGNITEAVVGDFGITLAIDDAEEGKTNCSAARASPKLVRTNTPSPHDDQYAFGCTLYRLLNGKEGQWALDVLNWYKYWILGAKMPTRAQRAFDTWLANFKPNKTWDFKRPADPVAGVDDVTRVRTLMLQLAWDMIFNEDLMIDVIKQRADAIQLQTVAV